MFEITAEDVSLLNDEDLRTVVARLCEAELRRRGFCASHVTWGGDQSAADGGIDVQVALPPNSVTDGFIPRPTTGFQVKKQGMARADIIAEMRPQNAVRASIQGLAGQSGAYIIVSSEASTSETALAKRREAMREAIVDLPNANALHTDFYDQTRLATWVRSHSGLIALVRTLIGKAVPGWSSYGPWAGPVTAEYILDDKLCLQPARRDTRKGLSALEGIQHLRDQLRAPRSIVRLVGLSGFGKTRLVQALFDEKVGENNLDPALAFYTNMSDDPDPKPVHLAFSLVTAGIPAILVIDNCQSDLHQRLSEVCRNSESQVSAITVEYDITEDMPEATEVFTLESSSTELIEKLIRQRFPELSVINARTVADFSGGNARIAIAISATIESNETIAGLTDEQLFQRLFRQRHAPDEALYISAQACSLVYSFQVDDQPADACTELHRLGQLCGNSALELYRSVAELQRRNLVQHRSVWRAVLPHAVANRLAKAALQNTPYREIEKHLLSDPSKRLMKSFSRRLGYLNDSKEAVQIVKNWIGVGGLIADVANLDDVGTAMFENISPTAPEDALAAVERSLSGQQSKALAENLKKHFSLLRSIAYDPALFERCTTLMVAILTTEEIREQAHETRVFASLFQLWLSGTHATIEQRVACSETLLVSQDKRRRALGIVSLKALLKAGHFFSTDHFEFGLRSRDYGYWPQTRTEVKHWFELSLNLAQRVSLSGESGAPHAKIAISEAFRELWMQPGVPDHLATICRAIRNKCFWPEGWVAARTVLELDGGNLDSGPLTILKALEADLRPQDLLQKVRSVVLSRDWHGLDFDDFGQRSAADISSRMDQAETLSRSLGQAVAGDEVTLDELLPELIAGQGRLHSFGAGLAEGSTDAEKTWRTLTSKLDGPAQSSNNPHVLFGFLQVLQLRKPALAASILDDALEDQRVAPWYPYLQAAVPIGPDDVARLARSLVLGKIPAEVYRALASCRATDSIPVGDLKDFLFALTALPSGFDVATDILHMRLHSDQEGKQKIAPELADIGCDLLKQVEFAARDDREDYRLGDIAKVSLTGPRRAEVVHEICRKFKSAIARHATSPFYYDDFLDGLFCAQPSAALEGFCGGDKEQLEQGVEILQTVGTRHHPLSAVTDEELTRWCEQEPHSRYLGLAQVIEFCQSAKEDSPSWTTTALMFLRNAPDPCAVLDHFVSRFRPSSGWVVSLTATLEMNSVLLDQLQSYPALTSHLQSRKQMVREWISREKRREADSDRLRDERFE